MQEYTHIITDVVISNRGCEKTKFYFYFKSKSWLHTCSDDAYHSAGKYIGNESYRRGF